MKKRIILYFTILCIPALTHAQVRFEPGYFIDNGGKKKTCLIKNVNWDSSPEKFNYLLTDNGEVIAVKLKSVKEFGIINKFVFKRFVLKSDTLMLQELVRGAASLYSCSYKGVKRYYYNNSAKEITELINNKPTDIPYSNQLYENLNCKNTTLKKIKDIEYRQADLVQYFISYNKCVKSEYFSLYDQSLGKIEKNAVRVNLRAGISRNTLSLEYLPNVFFDGEFSNKISPQFGFEMEVLFSKSKRRWAIAFEPNISIYKNSIIFPEAFASTSDEGIVNYTSYEISFVGRRYFDLSKQSKWFVNGGVSVGVSGSSTVVIEGLTDLETGSILRGALGAGVRYKDKFYVELRQMTNDDWFKKDEDSWSTKFGETSLLIGLMILSN